MPVLTFIAENQTAQQVVIDDIGIIVPASGFFTLSDTLFVREIIESKDLLEAINNDQILINNGSETLTKEDSIKYTTPVDSYSAKSHLDNDGNPHNTAITDLKPAIFDDLNALITDTELDDGYTSRTPSFGAFLSSSGLSFTSGAVTVPFNNILTNSDESCYSMTNGEITIFKDGTYLVFYEVSLGQSATNIRTSFQTFLERDSGSGFVEVPGFVSYVYSRQRVAGEGTASSSLPVEVGGGDVFRVRAFRKAGGGTGTGEFKDNGSRITIIKLG